ncbi:MAG: helix-turn-helix domain-containing protein [Gammaproteobacteria bacterium]|nr:helix-turn-helix domain-containing protein [Gammaproteobacteria bacterium]
MSDTPQPDNETEPDAPIAGMRLAAARRARDISVLDIAKELHLDELKVRALEENNFEVFGAPVFVKGHLRKYAELVGVPMDDILADYYSLNRAVGAPPVVGRPRAIELDYHIGRWIAAIAIIALLGAVVGAVYWWFENRSAEPLAQTDTATLAPFASSAENDIDELTGSEPAASLAETVGVGDADTESAVAAIDASPPAAAGDIVDNGSAASEIVSASSPSDEPLATLAMNFSGDCWTEVSDAAGKRLYFDLGTAGRNVTVTGAAPLRALFGNSENVNVTVNGQDYIIPASMRSGRTARLTVNAP